ncbi:acyltransferase [Alkaliphilus oremlandii]|uniref:acyltransferase n=1 Tax=Alkaliphilus oremlandii TaxID=461876 RepID=UPI0002E3FB75|nr:acyltransferase [Alkaliphilus oremlandii]
MSLEKSTDKKLYGIELMRGISCLLVIMIHVTASFWIYPQKESLTFKWIIALNTISRFAVPSFIFMSGFTLFYFYSRREFSFISFYKKRMVKAAIPYLLWSFFYTGINYRKYLNVSVGMQWGQFFKEALLGLSSYHLYFMLIIIQFYFIFPVLLRIYKKVDKPMITFIFCGILNLVFIRHLNLPLRDRLFPYYLIYFIAGFVFADLRLKGRKFSKIGRMLWGIAYIVAAVYYVVDHYRITIGAPPISPKIFQYIFMVYGVISSSLLYILLEKLEENNLPWMRHPLIGSLSAHSFSIYLVHPFLMKCYQWLEGYVTLDGVPLYGLFLVKSTIIFMSSWGISIVLSQIKIKLLQKKHGYKDR